MAKNRKARGRFAAVCFAATVCVAVAGCGATKTPASSDTVPAAEHEFRVSVSTGGSTLQNPQEELVHRIALTKADRQLIGASWPTRWNLPFEVARERDAAGGVAGLRLLRPRQALNLPSIGLAVGDLIVSVNHHPALDPAVLKEVLDEVGEDRECTMTLQRNGQAQVNIYYNAGR